MMDGSQQGINRRVLAYRNADNGDPRRQIPTGEGQIAE
jgi:hypothetical protein